MLSQGVAEDLISELIAGAKRVDLHGKVVQRLREARTVRRRLAESIAKPALLAAEVINTYVLWVGFDPEQPDRPGVQNGRVQRKIFEPVPPVADLPQLSEDPQRYDRTFYEDWFVAFRGLVDANAMEQGGQLIDLEQNHRLGELLKSLAGA
jgi:hypothetical protein